MILVDSSVWIDYLRNSDTEEVAFLEQLIGRDPIGVGDLILAEVLQGCRSERHFTETLGLLESLDLVEIGGRTAAIEAARNFQRLRDRGITVRKTVDCLIATRCILDGLSLLYSDRDFDPFVKHLGLVSAMA